MSEHVSLPVAKIHIPYNWSYADATARLAAGGFVSGDVGKLAYQVDTGSLWILTATTPTWKAVSAAALSATEVSAPVFAADAGSNDTYVATLSPAPSAYVTGTLYRFKANTVNTGAATINFNGLGAKTIKKLHDQDLADGDIESGQWVDLVYDGTNMQMQSQIANAPAAGAGGFAASGANADITSMTALSGSLKAPTQILDTNSNEVLKFGSTASAVNEVTITNKATGTGPTVEATGGDTNIDLNLKSKGTGAVQANGLSVATSNTTQTLTDGATVTWATGGVQFPNATVTLGGNRTLAITGAVSGQSGTLVVKQDGTGSRTLTLPGSSKVRDGGSGAITLSTAASSIDILTYFYDGTNYFWTYAKNYS